MATKRVKPPNGMKWLTDWIALCLAGPTKKNRSEFDNDMRLMRKSRVRPHFVAISADPAILETLSRIYQKMLGEGEKAGDADLCKATIKRFITNSCCLPNIHSNVQKERDGSLSPNRSDTAREIADLAKSAKKIADQIERLRQPLGGATSVEYLQRRFAAGNKDGFSAERHGFVTYRQAKSTSARVARLQGLLACFALDAVEESQRMRAQIKDKREVAGKRAVQNSFIDQMLANAATLTAKKGLAPNFALIAKVGSHVFPEGLDASAIGKRYRQ